MKGQLKASGGVYRLTSNMEEYLLNEMKQGAFGAFGFGKWIN